MVSVILISLITIGSCFATPTIIILLLIAIYAAYIAFVRRKYKEIPNPPFTNYFLGNATELMLAKHNRHLLWLTWDKSYGPMFKFCVFHKVIVMVTSSELAKQLCLNSNYPKAKVSYFPLQKLFGEPFMGNGLLTEMNHEIWRVHRGIFNPAFYKKSLRNFVNVFDENALKLVSKIESQNGETFSLLDYLGRVLMDVICEVGFSFKSNCLDDKNSPFPASMYTCLRAITESLSDPFYALKPWNWKEVKKRKLAAKYIRDTGRKIIQERQKTNKPFNDILNSAMENMKEHQLTEEQLIDDFVTLFVAGQETTSSSIAFLFYLLSIHKDDMRRAQEEADQFFIDNSEITAENLEDLKFIDACWHEALRLYPPAYATVREIPEGLQDFNNHILPIGTNIVINILAINYNSCVNGASFCPQRIYNNPDKAYNNIPFSIGQRSCIGRFFAEIEAKIVIVRLLSKFDFQIALNQSFDVDEALTLRLFDGCMIRMTERA